LITGTDSPVVDCARAVVVNSVANVPIDARLDKVFAVHLARRITVGDPDAAGALLGVIAAGLACADAGDSGKAENEIIIIQVISIDSRTAGRIDKV
jgi:hypothetical protein